jgi:hypothetical protein
VEVNEPCKVSEFQYDINITKKALYTLHHKLREHRLLKVISVWNATLLKYTDPKEIEACDLDDDDWKKFNEEELKIILKKFNMWTKGMTPKQRQDFRAQTCYWSLDIKGKEAEILKTARNNENLYREKEEVKEDE